MTFDPRVNVSNGRRPMLSCVFIPNGDGLDPPEAEARLREPLALGNRTTMRKRRSTASWWRWWRRRPCPNRRIAASGKTDEDWRSGFSGWSWDYWPRWPVLGSQKGPRPLFLFLSAKLSLKTLSSQVSTVKFVKISDLLISDYKGIFLVEPRL